MDEETISKRRSKYSDREAIFDISRYGVARVLEVTDSSIVQEFVQFDLMPPNLRQLAELAYKIHSNSNTKGNLVHGDFGPYNITVSFGDPKCYDYEHTHYGNIYVDLGRVILRSCRDVNEVRDFFTNYSGAIPSTDELREGLISFCEWQHLIRAEKGLLFQEVPLIRRERLFSARSELDDLLEAFKSEVVVK